MSEDDYSGETEQESRTVHKRPFHAEGIIRRIGGREDSDYEFSVSFATVPPEGWFEGMADLGYTLVNAEVIDGHGWQTGDVENVLEKEIGDIDYKRANELAEGPFSREVVYDFDLK